MMPDSGAEPIDPALARKLDAFTVPALPDGFASRAMAAALALPADAAPLPELPRQRSSRPRRWLRLGGAGLGVIAAGMLSISAAAMGYFGEPLREAVDKAPVIATVIEKVIPARLRHREKPVPALAKAPVKPAPVARAIEPSPAPEAMPPMGPMRRRFASPEERRAWMQAHPEQAERMIERRQAWMEAHPARAARIEQRRRAWAQAHPQQAARLAEQRRILAEQHPEAAARIEARRARLQRQRIEAGLEPPQDPQAEPFGPEPGARQQWRMERRERMRRWRERRF